MDKRLEQLKAEYYSIPIPDELDEVVNKALRTRPKRKNVFWKAAALTAAAALLLTITLNISPALANTLSDVPVIGKIVRILTFQEIKETKNNSSIEIKTPAIEGLDNTELQNSLNSKYIAEGKELYKQFEESMAALKAGQNGNTAINSDYEVLTDNERILSIRRYTEQTQASSYVENKYDTIDKQNEILLSLKSLFKDDRYIEVISEEIKTQMKQQMKADSNKSYWIQHGEPGEFKQIKENQPFYINADHKLVIVFNKYEAAPGYMGTVEFVIPTDVLSNILVSNLYIN